MTKAEAIAHARELLTKPDATGADLTRTRIQLDGAWQPTTDEGLLKLRALMRDLADARHRADARAKRGRKTPPYFRGPGHLMSKDAA